jgi:hypothetical protein
MSHIKVSTVQKARYGVLLIPIAWLLFSVWIAINEASQRFTYSGTAEINTPPSIPEILSLSSYACMTLWVFVKILQAVKQHTFVSSELKSGFVFLLGLTLMTASSYSNLSQLLSYVGMALIDVAAVIMLVTLIQGKPFGPLKLYHQDIQIKRSSE